MSKIKLRNKNQKVAPIELEREHAERLLKMANNGGWERVPETKAKNGKKNKGRDSEHPKESSE